MDRTTSGGVSGSASVFEGWNIGAVSVKRVRLHESGAIEADVRRHGGDPAETVRCMLGHGSALPDGAVVTGLKPLRSSPCPTCRNRSASKLPYATLTSGQISSCH